MERNTISMSQFVNRLYEYALEKSKEIGAKYSDSWLKDGEIEQENSPLLRKDAARIIHNYLKAVLGERDDEDVSQATRLLDVFDCRVCAGHVMQIYTKGIMEAVRYSEDSLLFGMNEAVSMVEAEEIIEKMHCKEKRCPKKKATSQKLKASKINTAQAIKLIEQERDFLIVDVRSESEYVKEHIGNAIHRTMAEILKNPYGVCERRNQRILLYCEGGHQSKVAAECLAEAGYKSVYYTEIMFS